MGLIASSLIKKHLKKVVRPAEGERLNYSFKNGRVIELRDVEINCDLFEGADLPFDFSWIRVGYIRIDLPDVLEILSARKAINVLVQDVSGTARPRHDFHFSDASRLRAHMENQMNLALYEFLHHGSKPNFENALQAEGAPSLGGKTKGAGAAKGKGGSAKMGMMESLITKSIDLVTLRLDRVHLRVIHDTPNMHAPASTAREGPADSAGSDQSMGSRPVLPACFIGIGIRRLDVVGEKPEAELGPAELVRRRKRKILRATGKQWICKAIKVLGLVVYAGSGVGNGGGTARSVSSSEDSSLWGMPMRPWTFSPLPLPAQTWTCEVCRRKKTPLAETVCRVCRCSRQVSSKLKARIARSGTQSAATSGPHTPMPLPADEERHRSESHERLSKHFAAEMSLLFRSDNDRADVYRHGEAGWRAFGLLQSPAPFSAAQLILCPTDIEIDLVLNQTMSAKLSASKERSSVPIVSMKVQIGGSTSSDFTLSPQVDLSEASASAKCSKPMTVHLNPRTVRPLTTLLDSIGSYNNRALAWRFKPRVVPDVPMFSAQNALGSTMSAAIPRAVFFRPLAGGDVDAASSGTFIVEPSQLIRHVNADRNRIPASVRNRAWWRYAIRGTVQNIRRKWKIATVDELLELVNHNFAASLEVHHSTGADFGNFEAWLGEEICRVSEQPVRLQRAVQSRSSQFVRLLCLSKLFQEYVVAFKTVRTSENPTKVKAAGTTLEHLEARLAFDWQPDSDVGVFKSFRKFTRKALLLFSGSSAQQRSILQRQASRSSISDSRMARNPSNESVRSHRSDSSGSSPSRITERRGSLLSASSDGSASSASSSANELLTLFSDLGNQVSAVAPGVVDEDFDGSWETALSQLERMDPVGKIVDLEISMSIRLALSLPECSGNFIGQCGSIAPFVDVELDRVQLRMTKRLKYTQAALKVAELNVFDNTDADHAPNVTSNRYSSLVATTVPRLQHFQHGLSTLDEQSDSQAFLDLAFEHPQLSPGLRQQYPLVIPANAKRNDAPLQRTMSLPAMRPESADNRSPSVVAAASFRLPTALVRDDLRSVAVRTNHAENVGAVQALAHSKQHTVSPQDVADARVEQLPAADPTTLGAETTVVGNLRVLCNGGWCYKKTGPEERFKLEPRFVWLGFLRDPRKATTEAEKASSIALFWDKSAPKVSSVACEATALDGRISLTFRPGLTNWIRSLEMVKIGKVQLGPPPLFFKHNNQSAVQIDSGHAIDTRECVSFVHYKQSLDVRPYKSTINIVPCGRKNESCPAFLNIDAEALARAVSFLCETAYQVSDAFSVSPALQMALDDEAEAVLAALRQTKGQGTGTESPQIFQPSLKRRSSYAAIPQKPVSSRGDVQAEAAEAWRRKHRNTLFVRLAMRPVEIVFPQRLVQDVLPKWMACFSAAALELESGVDMLPEDVLPSELIARGEFLTCFNAARSNPFAAASEVQPQRVELELDIFPGVVLVPVTGCTSADKLSLHVAFLAVHFGHISSSKSASGSENTIYGINAALDFSGLGAALLRRRCGVDLLPFDSDDSRASEPVAPHTMVSLFDRARTVSGPLTFNERDIRSARLFCGTCGIATITLQADNISTSLSAQLSNPQMQVRMKAPGQAVGIANTKVWFLVRAGPQEINDVLRFMRQFSSMEQQPSLPMSEQGSSSGKLSGNANGRETHKVFRRLAQCTKEAEHAGNNEDFGQTGRQALVRYAQRYGHISHEAAVLLREDKRLDMRVDLAGIAVQLLPADSIGSRHAHIPDSEMSPPTLSVHIVGVRFGLSQSGSFQTKLHAAMDLLEILQRRCSSGDTQPAREVAIVRVVPRLQQHDPRQHSKDEAAQGSVSDVQALHTDNLEFDDYLAEPGDDEQSPAWKEAASPSAQHPDKFFSASSASSAISFDQFTLESALAPGYETASADSTTTAAIGKIEITVDSEVCAQLFSDISALQFNVFQPQESAEDASEGDQADQGGTQPAQKVEPPAPASRSDWKECIGLDHWIHRHRLRNVAVRIHSITSCLALGTGAFDGNPEVPVSSKTADDRQLVVRITGMQGTLFQEASYAHISATLQGVCAEIRTEAYCSDGDGDNCGGGPERVFPLLRFGGRYTADSHLVASAAFHQNIPAVTATISNSSLTAHDGATLPDIAHLPPALQRAFHAAFSRQASYHDPQSVATSCSKAFCRLDELELFGQPHTLQIVLTAVSRMLGHFPRMHTSSQEPKQVRSEARSTNSAAVYEPGMLENGARILRALPTVDFELAGVRVLISDFDVFSVTRSNTSSANQSSPLQYCLRAALTAELRCGSCIVGCVDRIAVRCSAEHRCVKWASLGSDSFRHPDSTTNTSDKDSFSDREESNGMAPQALYLVEKGGLSDIDQGVELPELQATLRVSGVSGWFLFATRLSASAGPSRRTNPASMTERRSHQAMTIDLAWMRSCAKTTVLLDEISVDLRMNSLPPPELTVLADVRVTCVEVDAAISQATQASALLDLLFASLAEGLIGGARENASQPAKAAGMTGTKDEADVQLVTRALGAFYEACGILHSSARVSKTAQEFVSKREQLVQHLQTKYVDGLNDKAAASVARSALSELEKRLFPVESHPLSSLPFEASSLPSLPKHIDIVTVVQFGGVMVNILDAAPVAASTDVLDMFENVPFYNITLARLGPIRGVVRVSATAFTSTPILNSMPCATPTDRCAAPMLQQSFGGTEFGFHARLAVDHLVVFDTRGANFGTLVVYHAAGGIDASVSHRKLSERMSGSSLVLAFGRSDLWEQVSANARRTTAGIRRQLSAASSVAMELETHQPMINFTFTLTTKLFYVKSDEQLLVAQKVPGNSRLRLSLVVGPAIAIVSDFVTVVLQKMAVFDEFVTEMPQATAGSKPTVRPFTVAHDFEDDTAGEASGVLHQLVNGQAIILRSSDNSTVFAAPLITDVALHLDGFSLFCKNLVRPGLNSGNEPPVEEEYLNVQLSNIEVSVSSECHSAEKHVQVDSDRSGLRNDGCKWNFLVALSDLRIDTFKFSLGNEEAADLFRTSVFQGRGVREGVLDELSSKARVFLPGMAEAVAFLNVNAEDVFEHHKEKAPWHRHLWRGARHSILEPFAFDFEVVVATHFSQSVLRHLAEGPEAENEFFLQPVVQVTIEITFKGHNEMALDVSLDFVQAYGSTVASIFAPPSPNAAGKSQSCGVDGNARLSVPDSLANQNAAIERQLRYIYRNKMDHSNEIALLMEQYAFAPAEQQRELVYTLQQLQQRRRRFRANSAGRTLRWRSMSILNAACLQHDHPNDDSISEATPIGHDRLDEWTASPLYVLKSATARLNLPPTSVSLVSNAATTPIGVEFVLQKAELTVDTFPSGMLHPKDLDADGRNATQNSQYMLDAVVCGKLQLQLDYLALHAKPVLEPWALNLEVCLQNQSGILLGTDYASTLSGSKLHRMPSTPRSPSATSTNISLTAKSKMAFRVDFDYLRGLLHLLDEVQNLNLMPVPLHSRVIPTTDMPHSSSSSPGILHKESTKPGIGILNLSGIPLCVRLSQFFFKNPSTAHMKGEPDFSASQNVASAQHTTEWCPIPAIEYGLLVVSGQDDVVIVPGASRYRSPHGGLLDIELELQFEAGPLLSAVGLQHLEDTAFSCKAMTLTSYSLRPMADVLKSKYYVTLPLAVLSSTQHRFHWYTRTNVETEKSCATQPHDFSTNPSLNVVPLTLDADAQKSLPRGLLAFWKQSKVNVEELLERPGTFHLPCIASDVEISNVERRTQSSDSSTVAWQHLHRGDIICRLNSCWVLPNQCWDSLLASVSRLRQSSSSFTQGVGAATSSNGSDSQRLFYYVDVVRPADLNIKSALVPDVAIEFDAVSSVYSVRSCVAIVNEFRNVWSSFGDGSDPPAVQVELQYWNKGDSSQSCASETSSAHARTQGGGMKTKARLGTRAKALGVVVIAQEATFSVPLEWLAKNYEVSFRLRFVQPNRAELVSEEWSPRFPIAEASSACIGQKHELDFTVPEQRMSAAFPFHCALEIRAPSEGLVEWALRPIAVLQNLLPVPVCFCIISKDGERPGGTKNMVMCVESNPLGKSSSASSSASSVLSVETSAVDAAGGFICPTCKRSFASGQLLVKHCSAGGCTKAEKKAVKREGKQWRREFKKQMKEVGVKGLDFQAMKKIKDVANVIHCPACALPFQACDALFQHLTVHSGLKLSSVSGILPPAASRGVTICDETRFGRALLVFGIPETDLASLQHAVLAGEPEKSGAQPNAPTSTTETDKLQAHSISSMKQRRVAFAGFTKFSALAKEKEKDFVLYPTGTHRNSRGALRLNIMTDLCEKEEASSPQRQTSGLFVPRPSPPGSSRLWQSGSSSFLFAVASKLWIVNRTKLTLMPNSDYYEIGGGASNRTQAAADGHSFQQPPHKSASYTLQILTGQRDLRLKLRSDEDVAHSAHLEATERSRSEAHSAVVDSLAATFAATGEFLSLKTPWSDKLEVDWEKQEESSTTLKLQEGPSISYVSTSIAAAPGIFGRSQVITVAPTFVIFNQCSYTIQLAVESMLLAHQQSALNDNFVGRAHAATLASETDPSFIVTIGGGQFANVYFAPTAKIRMRARVLKDALPHNLFSPWSSWSDSFNFLSLRDGSDKIALGSDDPSAVGGSGVRGSGGGGGSNEKQRAKVEATARASARAQNQVLAVSHAQLAHAKVFVSNNLCELRVIKLSGLNNRQVALSDVTFGFEDARNASQRQFARRHLGGTSSIAAERHPGVRSLGQLGTLDTQLRAMAPQAFGSLQNPIAVIAAIRTASLATHTPLSKSTEACEVLTAYLTAIMNIRRVRESKVLLDFVIGPTMDTARSKSYFQMETKKNPNFPAQRLVTITPIQSSHLLPYVVMNKSSLYWLKIRCSSSTKSDDRGPTNPGEELTRRLESLRLRHQRGLSQKSGSRSAGHKLKQAAKSFSNFFRGKSMRPVTVGEASRAADDEVDNALYGEGTKPITVEPFIWTQFPLTVDTASLPVFRVPLNRSSHTALGLNGGELYQSNCSTRLVPPLSSTVFCPNNGGYDIFEIFVFDSLLGEALQVSNAGAPFAKSLKLRESTQLDRVTTVTLSDKWQLRLHIKKQHGCQNVITVSDISPAQENHRQALGSRVTTIEGKRTSLMTSLTTRLTKLEPVKQLLSTIEGFSAAVSHPVLQKQMLYQDMLDAYASRLYLNRSLQKLSAEFEFLEENQPVTMRAASDPYLGLRTPSVQTGLAADVSMRGIEVLILDNMIEVVRLSIGRISASVNSKDGRMSEIASSVEFIQVDNQLTDAYFPVIFEAGGGTADEMPVSQRTASRIWMPAKSGPTFHPFGTLPFLSMHATVRHHPFTNVVEKLDIAFPFAAQVHANGGRTVDSSLGSGTRRSAGIVVKVDSELLVRMLGIIHRLTAMQEQLLRSSAASRLMHWFERGSDFSALAEELRKKRDGVLAAFQAKISADHFSANGPVNYETSVNAPPSTPRPTMAQAALAAAAIEHATPSVLSDADMDAAATVASAAAAAREKQLVFGTVHMDQLTLLVSIANLNNRELSAALGMRGFARGLLKVIARLDTARFSLPAFDISDALISLEGLAEIVVHTHSSAFVSQMLKVLLNPTDARKPPPDIKSRNRRLAFPHMVAGQIRAGQGYFLAQSVGCPARHYVFHAFVKSACIASPMAKAHAHATTGRGTESHSKVKSSDGIEWVKAGQRIHFCVLVTTSLVHILRVQNSQPANSMEHGERFARATQSSICNFDSQVTPIYTFGLPHALGTSHMRDMLVVRNVTVIDEEEVYLDFFDIPVAQVTADDVGHVKRSKARMFFYSPRAAWQLAQCLGTIVRVTPRQRNVLRLRYQITGASS